LLASGTEKKLQKFANRQSQLFFVWLKIASDRIKTLV
jgi:hypothetical protein